MHHRSPLSPSPTYLDPVTGNILIQALLAGAAAVAVTYNSLKTRLQVMFGKKSEKKDEPKKTEQSSEKKEEQDLAAEEAVQAPPS